MLMLYMCMHAQSCPTLCKPTRLLCPWDSPSKNTGVGSHFLLQRIFLIQGLNPHLLFLLHGRQILYPLSHWGSLYLSHFSEIPWTIACQAPLSMGLLRQEY